MDRHRGRSLAIQGHQVWVADSLCSPAGDSDGTPELSSGSRRKHRKHKKITLHPFLKESSQNRLLSLLMVDGFHHSSPKPGLESSSAT